MVPYTKERSKGKLMQLFVLYLLLSESPLCFYCKGILHGDSMEISIFSLFIYLFFFILLLPSSSSPLLLLLFFLGGGEERKGNVHNIAVQPCAGAQGQGGPGGGTCN
jgi:hypothetical protein